MPYESCVTTRCRYICELHLHANAFHIVLAPNRKNTRDTRIYFNYTLNAHSICFVQLFDSTLLRLCSQRCIKCVPHKLCIWHEPLVFLSSFFRLFWNWLHYLNDFFLIRCEGVVHRWSWRRHILICLPTTLYGLSTAIKCFIILEI